MKSKLLIFITIISIMIPLFLVPALASEKVVDITRPEGNEVVTKDVFSICGSSIDDEATIEVFYKDKETEQYKPLLTTEGESSFTVGKLFGKDIKLKYKEGENVIRIKSYTKSTKSEPQVNTYTITVAEEKEKDNWVEKALNWFKKTDADEKK